MVQPTRRQSTNIEDRTRDTLADFIFHSMGLVGETGSLHSTNAAERGEKRAKQRYGAHYGGDASMIFRANKTADEAGGLEELANSPTAAVAYQSLGIPTPNKAAEEQWQSASPQQRVIMLKQMTAGDFDPSAEEDAPPTDTEPQEDLFSRMGVK